MVPHPGKSIAWGRWAIAGSDRQFGGQGSPDSGEDYGPAPGAAAAAGPAPLPPAAAAPAALLLALIPVLPPSPLYCLSVFLCFKSYLLRCRSGPHQPRGARQPGGLAQLPAPVSGLRGLALRLCQGELGCRHVPRPAPAKDSAGQTPAGRRTLAWRCPPASCQQTCLPAAPAASPPGRQGLACNTSCCRATPPGSQASMWSARWGPTPSAWASCSWTSSGATPSWSTARRRPAGSSRWGGWLGRGVAGVVGGLSLCPLWVAVVAAAARVCRGSCSGSL